jgi:hypothetical protein
MRIFDIRNNRRKNFFCGLGRFRVDLTLRIEEGTFGNTTL